MKPSTLASCGVVVFVRRGHADVLQALTQTHSTFLKGVTDTPEEIAVRLVTPD